MKALNVFTSVILVQVFVGISFCHNETHRVKHEHLNTMVHRKVDNLLPNEEETKLTTDRQDEQDAANTAEEDDDVTEGNPEYPPSSTINIMIDSLLEIGLQMVNSNIAVPDIETTIYTKVGLFNVSIKFKARQGELTDVKTLRRTGDTYLNVTGDTLRMKLILGFDKMSIFFNKYYFQVTKVPFRGQLKIDVHENEFMLDFLLNRKKEDCNLKLNSFVLTKFNKLEIHMTGVGPRWVSDKIASWIANHYRNIIRAEIERRVRIQLKIVMKAVEHQICDLLL
ncbi:hypothetical protein WDU94_001181 [Cyamophila willieti]